MVTATLYIEGGGEGRELGARFREGWNEFLNLLALVIRQRLYEVAHGNRPLIDLLQPLR